MKVEGRFFMNQPSGQLQGFILPIKWAEIWDEYVKNLHLDDREHADQHEFENFKIKYQNELKIYDADENVIVVYPWTK